MPQQSGKSVGFSPAKLRWKTSEGGDEVFPLGEQRTIIGRGKDCDIIVSDARVSRKHAEIRFESGEFRLKDLGSSNRTRVNGELFDDWHVLSDGEQIMTGPVEFRFELVPRAERSAQEEIPHKSTIIIPEPSSLPCLEIRNGPQKGLRFDLIKDRVVVGRAGRNQEWDLVLQDRAVSRPHAQIQRVENEFELKDLESANMTLVNGKPIDEPIMLADGDAITIGETILIFHVGEE